MLPREEKVKIPSPIKAFLNFVKIKQAGQAGHFKSQNVSKTTHSMDTQIQILHFCGHLSETPAIFGLLTGGTPVLPLLLDLIRSLQMGGREGGQASRLSTRFFLISLYTQTNQVCETIPKEMRRSDERDFWIVDRRDACPPARLSSRFFLICGEG